MKKISQSLMRDKSSHLRKPVKPRDIKVKICILSKVAKANLSNNNAGTGVNAIFLAQFSHFLKAQRYFFTVL